MSRVNRHAISIRSAEMAHMSGGARLVCSILWCNPISNCCCRPSQAPTQRLTCSAPFYGMQPGSIQPAKQHPPAWLMCSKSSPASRGRAGLEAAPPRSVCTGSSAGSPCK